ncbi:MAG: alpha/beta fold hydrolase [Muribaculaceae bacterium]
MSCNKSETIDELTSHYVEVGDAVKVHYKTSGEGDLAMVFVHGFGCDINTWQKQYEAFRDSDNLQLIFIDLPGYGESDKPVADYTFEYFAKAINAVLQNENVNRAIMIGHSLGTPVCRQMVFDYPEKVAALFDVDGVYCLYPEVGDESSDDERERAEQYDNAVKGFAACFCGDSVSENISNFAQSLAGPHTPGWIKRYALEHMPEAEEHVACSTMINLIDRKWWTGAWIDVPTTVICTQNSGLEPDNEAQMQKLYSNLDYVELTDCGHFIHMEQPELVNKKLAELLYYARSRTVSRIVVNGVNLLYEVAGNGKSVLLFHGNGGSHESVETTAGQLVRAGYKVYAIDSRGQGANKPVKAYHYKDMADDMFQFCKRLNIVQPAVFGWSDGGIVALLLEIRHPGTVNMMMICGANVEPTGVVNYEEFKRDILSQNNPLAEMMVWEPNITAEQLGGIKCPVMVCAGSSDLIVPEHTRYIADCIPGAELKIVEGEDHGSYIWHNKMAGEILLDYLARNGYKD